VLKLDSKLGKSVAALAVASLALALTSCASSTEGPATPDPTSSTAGPSAWSPEETEYLNAINDADLASSIFLSASNYVEIGATVCNGLKQDMPLDEILSALATSGKENGLNENQRNEFTLITSAAAVSFLCRDQIEKYKLTQ
jgi:ABC-type transport system substrate-binding protein